MHGIKETLLKVCLDVNGILGKSTLPHSHEAIIYSGYISQNKDDKFWILVAIYLGSLKNSR